MKSSISLMAFMAAFMFTTNANASDEGQQTIVVSATRPSLPSENLTSPKDIKNDSVRDAASMIDNVAGAAVIRNGSQTGIVQLRGLSQDRIKVRVDGMEITPACPNHMDPPMHYVMPNQVAQIGVVAGVTSVVSGGDSIGGTITINTLPPQFSKTGKNEFRGTLYGKYLGANDGYETALSANLGLEDFAFRIGTSNQDGGNLNYSGGEIALSGYQSSRTQAEAEMNLGAQTIGLALGIQRSRDVGTPALGMDMVIDDAASFRIGMVGDYGFGRINARIFKNDISHVMDNYTLRTLTPIASKMRAPAKSIDEGFNLGLDFSIGANNFKIGADGHYNTFDVVQQNVTNGMMRDLFNNSTRDRTGIFAEWDSSAIKHLRLVAGIRYETLKSDTDNIEKVMMMGENAAKSAFNALDKSNTDGNLDLTLSARLHVVDELVFEFGAAQKTRSPSIVERFLWSASSTYATADGRNYIGNLDLKPEISRQLNAAANVQIGNLRLRPSMFYNVVDDYIQGVAISTAPDATLKFQNIEAKLSGAELEFGFNINENWSFFGNSSYVRGEDTVNNDNLYRIAPLRANFGLQFENEKFMAIIEGKIAAKQNKVSKYNNEKPTNGFEVFNLRGRYTLNEIITINGGIENIFDKYYAEHLSGINRVNNSQYGGNLAIGERMPGAGRFGYLSINLSF